MDTKIYKYCTSRGIAIFESGKIKVTPVTEFNDPFEMMPSFQDSGLHDYIKKHLPEYWVNYIDTDLQFASMSSKQKKYYKKSGLKLFGRERLNQLIEDFKRKAVQELENGWSERIKEIGALCFTDKPNNLLMWAHYAENSAGFVIEFNSDHEFFHRQRTDKDEFFHLRPVVYRKKRPFFNFEDKLNGMDHVFLTKSPEWEYEKESRILYPLNFLAVEYIKTENTEYDMYSVPLPSEAVTGIILGCRANDNLINVIKNKSEYAHIEIRKIKLDSNDYKFIY